MAMYFRCDRCGGEIDYRPAPPQPPPTNIDSFLETFFGTFGTPNSARAEAGDFRVLLTSERRGASPGDKPGYDKCDLCRDCIHDVIDGKLREGV